MWEDYRVSAIVLQSYATLSAIISLLINEDTEHRNEVYALVCIVVKLRRLSTFPVALIGREMSTLNDVCRSSRVNFIFHFGFEFTLYSLCWQSITGALDNWLILRE